MSGSLPLRPFRFGLTLFPTVGSGAEWAAQARRAYAAGCSIVTVTDHFFAPGDVPRGGVWSSLQAAYDAEPRLRVGTLVLNNDLWNPAVVAREAGSMHVLTGGRFELGIGAGWDARDHETASIPREAPGVRIERLAHAVDTIERTLPPRAVPLVLGGGGRRILELAARRADIVSVHRNLERGSPASWKNGNAATSQADRVSDRIGWVRAAAGPRLPSLELHALLLRVVATDGPVDEVAAELGRPLGLAAADVLGSPHFLIGSVDRMAEELLRRRERWGFSYWTLTELADLDALAPVIAKLAGA